MNEFENVEKVLKQLEKVGVAVSPYEVRAILESAAERTLFQIKAGLVQNGVPDTTYDMVRKNDGKFVTKKNVSILMGVDWADPKAYLVNWMEYGTAPRFKKDGSSTGQVVGRSVIRKAYDANKKGMQDQIEDGLMDLVILEGRKRGF